MYLPEIVRPGPHVLEFLERVVQEQVVGGLHREVQQPHQLSEQPTLPQLPTMIYQNTLEQNLRPQRQGQLNKGRVSTTSRRVLCT